MKKLLLLIYLLVLLISSEVFATCTTTPKYMDGTVSIYSTGNFWINHNTNKHKVDTRIDNIINDNTYYDWNLGDFVEPTVSLNSCKTNKCYEYAYTGDIKLSDLYYNLNNNIYVTDKNIKDYQKTFSENDIKTYLNGYLLENTQDQADAFCKMKGFAKSVDYNSTYKNGTPAKEKNYKNPTKLKKNICYKSQNSKLSAKQYCIEEGYEDAKNITGTFLTGLGTYTCSYYSGTANEWIKKSLLLKKDSITKFTCFTKAKYTYSAKIVDNKITSTGKNCTDSKCINQVTCVENYNPNTKTYLNGKDYVLSNYSKLLKQINPNIDTSFKKIDENILSYNTGQLSFNFSNACKGYRCANFKNISLGYNYAGALTLFRPTNTTGIRLKIDETNTSFDSYKVTSLNIINFTGALDIQLPYSGCSNVKYDYKIYYKYTAPDDTTGFNLITADNFTLNTKDGSLSQKDIDEGKGKFIKIKYDKIYHIAKVQIPEGAYLSKAGKYIFYLYVKDEFGHETALKMNILPVEVVPGLPSTSTSKAVLVGYKSNTNYYTHDTFDIKFILKDGVGNLISNQTGINISYEGGTGLQFYLGNGSWGSSINGVKSYGYKNNIYFPVKIRFKSIGNHPLKFKIGYPKKDGSYSYISVSVLNGANTMKLPIIPKGSGGSDFNISCTNNRIVLNYKCIYDNFSGCWKNGQVIFTSESDNGKRGSLIIKDHAYNQKTKVYNINHIDKTPPVVKFTSTKTTILATKNPLTINIVDPNRPSGCSINKHLKVWINGNLKENKTIDYDGDATILAKEFEKSGIYNIKIQVTDAAGNITTLTKSIRVIPNNNIHFVFDHTVPNSTIYSDGKTEITSYFLVEDEFGNKLSGTNLIKNLHINSNSVLNEKTNNGDALYIKDFSKNISSDGTIWIKYVLYNNSKNNLIITGSADIYNREGTNASPYYNKLSNSSSIPFSFHVDSLKNIMSKAYFSGSNMITLGYDTTLWIKIPTICSSGQTLKNLNLKLNLSYKEENNGTPINNIKLVGGTGYVDMVKNLRKDSGYTLNTNVTCGHDIYIPFTGRFEATNGVPSPKFVVSGNVKVTYSLDGLGGPKTITKLVSFSNNIKVNYWGVNVVGMYSNSAKGLYELMRNVGGDTQMSKGGNNMNSKYKSYNQIVMEARRLVRGYNNTTTTLSDIGGLYYYKNKDIQLNGGNINKKSLIFVDGGNVYINGNIRKQNPSSNKTLTIVVLSKTDRTEGKVIINPSVTNIDAIIITQGGMFSYKSVADRMATVEGKKNSELKNQLAIYGFVLSKGNTIGGSIAMNGKYVLPGGKKIPDNTFNYYLAGLYDINFLRRYHYIINPGNKAVDPTKGGYLSDKYNTNPVVIFYDPAISSAYGF